MSILGRLISSFLLFLVWGAVEMFVVRGSGMLSAEVAGKQFENSDFSYLYSTGMMHVLAQSPVLVFSVFALLLVALWFKPLKQVFSAMREGMNEMNKYAILFALGASTLYVGNAKAYYDQNNWPEVYFIQPNQSAFFVPDQGANKDTQAKFGSEEYYSQNKVAAKRFDIPHQQLPSSSYWKNYWVPAGRLYIVDRTPAARVWVRGSRGTNTVKDEHLPCQSQEGLDVSAGISIGTSVTEENSPRFLYKFGVHPAPGDQKDPQIVFTSTFQGYSLNEVMDQRIHPKVMALVCDEFTKYPLDQINHDLSTVIMPDIEKKVKAYLEADGITLDFIGWADTLDFDDKVQEVINRLYISKKEAEIAAALAPVTKTLQELANVEATRNIASKFDGHLPQSLTILGDGVPAILGAILSNPPLAKPAGK